MSSNMAEKSKGGLMPRLRFPEFKDAGEWEEKRLGEILTFQAGFPFDSANFTSEKNGHRLIRNRDLKSDDTVIFYSGYFEDRFVVTNGDVLIGMDGDFTPCVWTKGKALLNQRVGRILPLRNGSKKFLYYFLTVHLKEVEGATARTTVKHLSHSAIEKINKPLPRLSEQQRIAACLSSLDDLITAEAKKLDALKAHKKGLMQELFPREGEAVPRLRFPEFRDMGEWGEKSIGEVFRVTRGEVLSMTLVQSFQSKESPYPVFSSQTKNTGLAGFYSDYLYEDAITWTTDGANAGDVNYRKGKFYCTNVCGVLINENGYANPCISELINSVAKQYVSYVGNPKLMNGVMSNIVIPFPLLPEQQKIASCLSSLDDLITAQARKVEALKTHKKGLMQQLFPVADTMAG